MTTEEAQRYLDARVEGAKTLADAYARHAENPTSFVAGVQYALDKLLSDVDRYGISLTILKEPVVTVKMLNDAGYHILERAKKGEPF
jgi:hypothetical protein